MTVCALALKIWAKAKPGQGRRRWPGHGSVLAGQVGGGQVAVEPFLALISLLDKRGGGQCQLVLRPPWSERQSPHSEQALRELGLGVVLSRVLGVWCRA